MSLWAVVPAKSLARSKSRLAPLLSSGERAALAARLLTHVLDLLASPALGLAGTLVVTDGDDTAALARSRGARTLDDQGLTPLGAVVDAGLVEAQRCGATRALVLMADLPELCADDLLALLHAAGAVALAPDRQRAGTSALLVPLPHGAPTRFGDARSFERHLVDLSAMRPTVVDRPGLAFDVDEPEDLARLTPR
jgi:2-phospho-L-lactate/phosphoenolpyruvate guanylyltransferase